eukprot:GHUV01054092.1.p1 GENE.GHUV01054092.1~~GHUV01054092.1.p1  ORF type:complete len:130 (+),score=3.93 GHUV01054092.1:143-532(+)
MSFSMFSRMADLQARWQISVISARQQAAARHRSLVKSAHNRRAARTLAGLRCSFRLTKCNDTKQSWNKYKIDTFVETASPAQLSTRYNGRLFYRSRCQLQSAEWRKEGVTGVIGRLDKRPSKCDDTDES